MQTATYIDPSTWDPIPGAVIDVDKYPTRGYPYPTPKVTKGTTIGLFGDDFKHAEVTSQNGRRVRCVTADGEKMQAVWDNEEGLFVPVLN